MSYDRSLSEWVLEFVEALKYELAAMRAEEPKIFTGLQEIRIDQAWNEELYEALTRSKVLVAILTRPYVYSETTMTEFETFSKRSLKTGKPVLLPVVPRGGENFLDIVKQFVWIDLKYLPIQKTSPSRRPSSWHREIMRVADVVNKMIDKAPLYDSTWTVASIGADEVIEEEVVRSLEEGLTSDKLLDDGFKDLASRISARLIREHGLDFAEGVMRFHIREVLKRRRLKFR